MESSLLRLLKPSKDLLSVLAGLPFLEDSPAASSKRDATLLLRCKVVPDLEAGLDLPVFIGIQGGTNVGKSTVFNALAGRILSPSVVVASATKHPLVYAHARWRDVLLAPSRFPGRTSKELEDPKDLLAEASRTDLVYFRFHDDDRLAALALVDSPDFDGALSSNPEVAAFIAAVSDVTVFVTTSEKYRDRVLVEQLRSLLRLKAEVIAVFNRLGEPIVFETLLDDLRSCFGEELKEAPGRLRAVRIPVSSARYPEEELRAPLLEGVLGGLAQLDGPAVKAAVVRRTLSKVLSLVSDVVERCSKEAAFEKEVRALAEAGAAECASEYRARFHLALPEETIAVRRLLSETELWPRLSLSPQVEKSRGALALAGAVIRRTNDAARRALMRLSRSDDGTVDEGSALEEYARARDKADADSLVQVLEPLRVRVESLVRGREGSLAMAHELLQGFFAPAQATQFPAKAREAHARALETCRAGENVVQDVESWIAARPTGRKVLGWGAIAFKLSLGLLLAWALPPETGWLGFLSPLKWIYFAGGYFLAAYAVALLVSWKVRARRRFRAGREKACRETVESVFVRPLVTSMEDLLTDEEVKRLRSLSKELGDALGGITGPDRLPHFQRDGISPGAGAPASRP